MDELQRIIQPKNSRYILEVKDRWETFYSKVQFYGVMKKAMKPPKTLNGGQWSMPQLCSQPCHFSSIEHCATKEAGHQQGGSLPYPDDFRRPRNVPAPAVPVVSSCGGLENCMIAVGSTPLTTFQKEQFDEGLLYLMAYYYAMHLTYPKILLSVRC
ncbi:hypothetical protein F7725_021446 [Dissostichus mawsoni]|uniref:Uncharacterized protein n=1 Tax=Dissostichus mawsoni TaxID=36200 RepID=A0A7J5ZE92_DISMA|nr:hypothetical protein F7725_021446 [Dissostichus mawsoni]